MTAPTAPPPVRPAEDRDVIVDDRLIARRIAVRRGEGLRRLKRLLALILVAATALGIVLVVRSPVFDVDAVTVRGARETDVESVLAAVDIEIGAPIFLADLGRAEGAVESLPWVADARVRRKLPGTVDVAIVERVPVAVLSGGGVAMLVDASGAVLAPAPAVTLPALVHVSIREVPPAVGETIDPDLIVAVTVADRVRGNPAGVVRAVVLGPLRLELLDGGTAAFGDGSLLDEKLEAFRTLVARVDLTCLDVADLSVPTRPVVTRRSECA